MVASKDMTRASTPLPRRAFQGHDFASMGGTLNRALVRMAGVGATRPCDHFNSSELIEVLSAGVAAWAYLSYLQLLDQLRVLK